MKFHSKGKFSIYILPLFFTLILTIANTTTVTGATLPSKTASPVTVTGTSNTLAKPIEAYLPICHADTCQVLSYDGHGYRDESAQNKTLTTNNHSQECIDFGNTDSVKEAACNFQEKTYPDGIHVPAEDGDINVYERTCLQVGTEALNNYCQLYCSLPCPDVRKCIDQCNSSPKQTVAQVGWGRCPQGCRFCSP